MFRPRVLDERQGREISGGSSRRLPLRSVSTCLSVHLGRCRSSLLALLPPMICPDAALIYYSITRATGCAHGLLPSGRVYGQDRKNPSQFNFCDYQEVDTHCETLPLFHKAAMSIYTPVYLLRNILISLIVLILVRPAHAEKAKCYYLFLIAIRMAVRHRYINIQI